MEMVPLKPEPWAGVLKLGAAVVQRLTGQVGDSPVGL